MVEARSTLRYNTGQVELLAAQEKMCALRISHVRVIRQKVTKIPVRSY